MCIGPVPVALPVVGRTAATVSVARTSRHTRCRQAPHGVRPDPEFRADRWGRLPLVDGAGLQISAEVRESQLADALFQAWVTSRGVVEVAAAVRVSVWESMPA
jgi:hypothetical protein